MPKILFLFIFNIILYTNLHPILIEKINTISNPTLLFEYDLYVGAIVGNENRIIAQNAHSIEEFILQENGLLSRISKHETKGTTGALAAMTNNKYYSWRNIASTGNEYKVRVFDITSQPMIEFVDVDFSLVTLATPNIQYYDKYILFTHVYDFYYVHGHPMALWETIVICSDSFIVIDTIKNFGNNFTRISGNLLAKLTDLDDTKTKIEFYNFNNFQPEYISEVELPLEIPKEVYFDGPNFIITYDYRVIVIDINNLDFPFIIHDMDLQSLEYYFHNSIYTGTHIICSDAGGNVLFYEISSDNSFNLVSRKVY